MKTAIMSFPALSGFLIGALLDPLFIIGALLLSWPIVHVRKSKKFFWLALPFWFVLVFLWYGVAAGISPAPRYPMTEQSNVSVPGIPAPPITANSSVPEASTSAGSADGARLGASKPMIYDDPEVFERFYGPTTASNSMGMKVRIWRHGDFILMHMDDRPSWMALDLRKADQGPINDQEVFVLADRYCGKLKWVLKRKDDKGFAYESEDRRCHINFYLPNTTDSGNPALKCEHVTLTYSFVDSTIKDL